MIRKIKVFILSVLASFPISVFAQAGSILPGSTFGNVTLPDRIAGQPATLAGTITGLILIVLQIVGLIAVAMIIYGGFRYVSSGGDEKVTESAKKTITNAVIGLVIVILSYVIVTIVTNLAFSRTGA
jgi:hypothetical protein